MYQIEMSRALDMILEQVVEAGCEEIPLTEALGRVLAKPILAERAVPPFDRSPLDGYAFRAADTVAASPEHPVSLHLQGEIEAGCPSSLLLRPGNCIRVATGAPLPAGSDAVMAQEKVKLQGDHVLINNPVKAESNVARAGEDIVRGETVLENGTFLDAVHLGVLASLGFGAVEVLRKPRVAVFSTGRELQTPGEAPVPGSIYDCNAPMLCALIEKFGGNPLSLGIVPDNLQDLATNLLVALRESNIVITTGGVSVGEQDLLGAAVKKIGARILFWRVALKPGTPMLAAIKNDKLILCLSGNPAAAFVSFDQFVRPALYEMSGRKDWQRPVVEAVLEEQLPPSRGQNRFIRAICSLNNGRFSVKVSGRECSGALSSLKDANAYIYLPSGTPTLQKGDRVTVQLFSLPQSLEMSLQMGLSPGAELAGAGLVC